MPKKTDPTDSATPGHAVYASITDVPPQLQRLGGAPLAIDQINRIVRVAFERREERTADDRISPEGIEVKGGVFYVEDYAGARREFMTEHRLIDGQWVALTPEERFAHDERLALTSGVN